jgi:hypothetical protein
MSHSITLAYTDAEWREITEEAARRGKKPSVFVHDAPLMLARVQQQWTAAHSYQPLDHVPIGEQTQYPRNSETEPGATK